MLLSPPWSESRCLLPVGTSVRPYPAVCSYWCAARKARRGTQKSRRGLVVPTRLHRRSASKRLTLNSSLREGHPGQCAGQSSGQLGQNASCSRSVTSERKPGGLKGRHQPARQTCLVNLVPYLGTVWWINLSGTHHSGSTAQTS